MIGGGRRFGSRRTRSGRNRSFFKGHYRGRHSQAGVVQSELASERAREANQDQSGKSQFGLPGNPLIVPRSEHSLSRKNIDPDALNVLYRLTNAGYQAFLVGGGVRDLLLGKKPKDFDISTSATPREVKSVFRNSRIIGRRFRIVHVFFQGNKIIEVSTLRAASNQDDGDAEVTVVKDDNTFGDTQSDALRRDITINGLFYDPVSFSLIDYVGGLKDLQNKTVRIIGDPNERLIEDPVRMIRAIRHAARAGFEIEPVTYQAICKNSASISICSKPRVYEELLRELRGTASLKSFALLSQSGLLEYLLPALHQAIVAEGDLIWQRLSIILSRFDELAKSGVELPPSMLFLALTLGNFKKGMLHSKYSAVTPESEETVWAAFPNVTNFGDLIADEENGVVSGATQEHRETKPEKRGRKQRWQLHRDRARFAEDPSRSRVRRLGVPSEVELTKSVHQIFTPIGVSRREQERMVRMLLGRYEMFTLWKQVTDMLVKLDSQQHEVHEKSEIMSTVNDFIKRKHFNDSLQLLELTSLSVPGPLGSVSGGYSEDAAHCIDFWLDRLNKFYKRKRGGSRKQEIF